ncbi:MAG: UbiA family prenyltransferase [Thermoproteota archaeon]
MAKVEDYIVELRTREWYKNLLVLLIPFFSKKILMYQYYPKIILGFIALSLGSSTGYVINDIIDVSQDLAHPEKRNRPIVSGKVKRTNAILLSIFLLMSSLTISHIISISFLILLVLMLLNMLAYTFFPKKQSLARCFQYFFKPRDQSPKWMYDC